MSSPAATKLRSVIMWTPKPLVGGGASAGSFPRSVISTFAIFQKSTGAALSISSGNTFFFKP